MQNLGFAFAMAPALEALYPAGEARDAAYRRHCELYNTHPYLAALVLGVAVRLEEQHSAGDGMARELLHSFKVGTMGGLGAVGDAFFWASLKPFCLVLALLWASLIDPVSAVVLFLAVYNLVHLSWRVIGFYLGYRMGVDSSLRLQSLNIPRIGKWVKRVTLGLLGSYAALAARDVALEGQSGLQTPWTLSLVLVSYGAWRCLQAGMSASLLLYVITALAVILSYLFL